MTTQRDGGPADVAGQVQRLASLWRAVTSRPMHPAGCTCMGHFLIPALNPRDMEADILDYMRGRYAAEGLDALVALLDAREAEREADTPLVPFRTWLLRLPESWHRCGGAWNASSPISPTPWSPLGRTAARRVRGAGSSAPEHEHFGELPCVSFPLSMMAEPACGVLEGDQILVDPDSRQADLKAVLEHNALSGVRRGLRRLGQARPARPGHAAAGDPEPRQDPLRRP